MLKTGIRLLCIFMLDKEIYIYFRIILGEKPGNFDIVIENDNVSKAYEKLRDFLMSNLKQGDAGIINSAYVLYVNYYPYNCYVYLYLCF